MIAKLLHSLSSAGCWADQGTELRCHVGIADRAALFRLRARGAFTGSRETTAGFTSRADNGTVLLDEIADAGPKLRVSLLRVLRRAFVRLERHGAAPSISTSSAPPTNHWTGRVAAGRFGRTCATASSVRFAGVPALRELAG